MSESRLSEALSSGIVESSDGPSAQLISEAQSIKLPKRSDLASSSQESTRERRLRISSVQLPRIEAGLAEKNAKLKLLRDAEAKLQAEISAAMAEQKRLNEEMSTLDLESKESTPLPSGQDSEVPSAERDVQPGGQPSPTTPSGDQQDEPSVEMSGALSPDTHRDDLPVDVPKVVAASVEPEATQEQPEDQSDSRDTHVDSHSAEVATSVQGELVSLPSVEVETEDVDVAMDMGSIDETTEPIAASSGVDDDITHSVADDPEMLRPPETTGRDTADQAHIDTPSFSPAPVDPTISITEDTPQLQVPEALETSGTMPTQISSVDVQANDAALEEHAETADAPREDDDEHTSEVRTSFVPYESPLQYFHAYRFHPNYSKSVPGGLKSLTYSNRIDTKKEVCPYELDGQACPKGDDCEFQHFQKMAAPDDQILLELGQSDEYAGDDKTRFMAGLRQLLTEFRAAKVKDFASIAQGIVDYRRRFLNDSSKVLRLEGVHI
ncbi:hypothetical protein UCRPA7_8600 [Phaeoacremonium minimum UCRPA7]|uniref:C3H1-type domain-containing protein n=1 Tax=Phaeoacremonium minimum (strain UCR-PA7) TaxID=1286976 RepID=R8B9I8_PHAM7|nr:hypothetical protein UCRPA7_8600 [Phaeoacremonium minimum UCRPA7]EON95947.1 hypothetical protein UCRPA7_8600 [Phaeoacremonium minimum UCRPA7]